MAPSAGNQSRPRRLRALSSIVVGFTLAAAATQVVVQAQEPPRAVAGGGNPNAHLEEGWKGSMGAPEVGTQVDFFVRFRPGPDGTLVGTIEIPVHGVENGTLVDIAISVREMRFTHLAPNTPSEALTRFSLSIAEDGRTAKGHLVQSGRALPVTMTRLAPGEVASIRIRRPQEPHAPYLYEQRVFAFKNPTDGAWLMGELRIPEGPGSHPAVVLLSDSGPHDRNATLAGHKPFFVLADHFAQNGIAVVTFDDRGVGNSGGFQGVATCELLAEDADAAVEQLRLQAEIDPERIGLLGHGDGAIVGALTAARSPHISFVVMLAGTGLPGRDILTMQAEAISKTAELDPATIDRATQAHRRAMDLLEQRAGDDAVRAAIRDLAVIQITGFSRKHGTPVPNDAFIDGYVAQQMQMIQSEWFRSFLFLDPRKVLGELKVPVLALIGSLDVQVPAAANVPAIRKALEEGKNPDATVRELPGLNHLFQPAKTGSPEEYAAIETTIDPSVLELVTQWIRKRTRLDP